jgi:hypothetical protein
MSDNPTETKRAMSEELKVMHRIEKLLKPLTAESMVRVGNWTTSMSFEMANAKRKANAAEIEGLLDT